MIEPIIPVPGEDLLELGKRCNAVYICPKDSSGRRRGPLVAYAGKDDRGWNFVGDLYFNFRRIEVHPKVVESFAKAAFDELWGAGVNAAILFPQAGPVTAEAWIKACQEYELHVIVGLAMTHKSFLASEGGYIMDDAPARAFELACKLGVRDFVVPGTKLELVMALRKVLERELGDQEFDLYSPGFISQGGDVTECGKVAGPNFHAIVGGAIYRQSAQADRRRVAMRVINSLLA